MNPQDIIPPEGNTPSPDNSIPPDTSLQPIQPVAQPSQPSIAPLATPVNEPSPTPAIQATEEAPKKEGGIISLIVTIVAAVALVQIINSFFLQSYRVFGSSMSTTLETSDRLIISKFGRTFAKVAGKDFQPERGEIIVFQSPIDPEVQLIKRVIGLPGERVVVADGKITVFNKENPGGFNPDDAPYGKNLPKTSGNVDITVPKGHLFVSGDNRLGSNSLDSRNELGTVPEGNIIGRLLIRIWPLSGAKYYQ